MKWFNKLLKLVGLDKELVSVTGGNTIASISSALFWLFLATLMIPSDYGQLNYYLSIAFVFGAISTLGLGNTLTTFLSKGKDEIIYQANLLVFFASIVTLILILFFINNFAVVALLLGISYFAMTKAEILGRKNYKKFFDVVVGQRFLGVPLSLLLYFYFGIDGIILGYAISTLLFSVYFFRSFKGFKFEFSFLKRKLRFTTHSMSWLVSGSVANNVDKLIIGPIFGFELLGIYHVGFQFLMVLSILPISVFQFLLPQQASKIPQKGIVMKSLLFSLILSVFFVITIPYIIPNLFPNFTESVLLSQIMVVGVIPMTLNASMYSRFFGEERSKIILLSAIVKITTLMTLILLLGNIYGLIGLALAFLLSLILESATLLTFSKIRPR